MAQSGLPGKTNKNDIVKKGGAYQASPHIAVKFLSDPVLGSSLCSVILQRDTFQQDCGSPDT